MQIGRKLAHATNTTRCGCTLPGRSAHLDYVVLCCSLNYSRRLRRRLHGQAQGTSDDQCNVGVVIVLGQLGTSLIQPNAPTVPHARALEHATMARVDT